MMVNTLGKVLIMRTSFSELSSVLEKRKNNSIFNTSYPLSATDWAPYIAEGALSFDVSSPLAFYIHIPFCKQLCAFCEYTRIMLPTQESQVKYIVTLEKDVDLFLKKYPSTILYGFDIGGGTPCSLSLPVFNRLLNLYRKIRDEVSVTADYEPSIEATFQTLSPEKAEIIASSGIERISLGLQSSSRRVLHPLKRRIEERETMEVGLSIAKQRGIKKINLDLMYGLPGQTRESCIEDISLIDGLKPEQVTLYEFRTNQLKSDYKVSTEKTYRLYSELFEGLIKIGYFGVFGQNTFTLNPEDRGVSSYLRHRMFDGLPYKGFGMAAQSMSDLGIAYNVGKNHENPEKFLYADTYESATYYNLPHHELFAKYIAIAGYSGGFSLSHSKRILRQDVRMAYKEVLDFLTKNNLAQINDDRFQLTPKGFRDYGAILSLFYPISKNRRTLF